MTPTQVILNTRTTIYVAGSNLDATSVVNWNGKALGTSYVAYTNYGPYVGANSLAATVPASF